MADLWCAKNAEPHNAGGLTEFQWRLGEAFMAFGTSVLSPREIEVTRLLLKGHSPRDIAALHGIAEGTVRNHLKSIYHKLDVSSVGELFGLFLEAISTMVVDDGSDPLLAFREFGERKLRCVS